MTLNYIPALLATAAIGTISLAIYFYQKKRKQSEYATSRMPTIWEPVGTVKSLFIYPLKSGHRLEIKTAECTEFGVQVKTGSNYQLRDRCLVVYKEDNKEFRTARTHPKLILIKVSVNKQNQFVLNAPKMADLIIDIPSLDTVKKSEEIMSWEQEKIFTIDCGDKAAKWLSKYILDEPVGLRLGFHDGLTDHRRKIAKTHKAYTEAYPNVNDSSMGLYTDLSSYLIINQSSVDELVTRIPESNVTTNNFRPNILVDGENIRPYDEDCWAWVKIGEVIFHRVKPCARCSLITIDPETGIRSPANEPLKTLKTYRKVKDVLTNITLEKDDPVMGVYVALTTCGQIHAGDTVFVGK